ncbi:substrate-binding domain-containing protein [Rhizobiaceae bacterium BDR2-2]|uniref:Substrate-binding domain-containing protein n=1 Tax=Ectorhizobium quercum TaxID=2965071 RepID=A0AAE3N2P7_9HYPH|nr:substrate-binding domain-containing protein [Ectorhizobium quercum]MCX8996144.1 substrate-binding domain-containing protein [Ectorhizobium quercum]MCX8998817.1 substrate-binding domain-containing protein [Ectorhizobium quercum]
MNLKQLSEMLGLSQTTVSRALNGFPEVSEATRQRVLAAAEKTGYRPNKAAQRLATGRARSIGLVMPTSSEHHFDVHFGEFLSGIGEVALKHDFHFVIMPADPHDEEKAIRRLASSGSVDGLYIGYLRAGDPRIATTRSLGLPFIVHGRSAGLPEDYAFLDIDNEAVFRDAADHMIDLGHRRFGLINAPEEFDFALRRRQGAENRLREAGIALDPSACLAVPMTDDQGYRAMNALLDRPARPTAVLCSSTAQALGAVRAIYARGLKLGRDISLTTHDDDLPLLKPENFSVPLTTTRSSLRAAGVRIAERLIGVIENGREPDLQEIWHAALVRRASTGPVPD